MILPNNDGIYHMRGFYYFIFWMFFEDASYSFYSK